MRAVLGRWGGLRRSLAALALIAAAGALGYVAGSLRAAHEQDASRARRASAAKADRLAFAEGRSQGLLRGINAGRVAAERQAGRAGRTRGRAAAVAFAKAHPVRRARPGHPGSEREGPPPVLTGKVLVVGDSLEVLTSPYLQRYLPSVHLVISAKGGYSSIQLYELFRESYDPSQSVVVFDAGTNDNPLYPQILESMLRRVAQTVGPRCLVVPTIHGLVVNGVTSAQKNRVVRAFAASRPGTQVPDWAHAVRAHPELMQGDDLHPNAAGADYRASLIAAGIRACLELDAAFPLSKDA